MSKMKRAEENASLNLRRTFDDEGDTSSRIKERLTSSVKTNLSIQPVIMISSLASSVIVARMLGPELLATVTSISAISATLVAFLDFGIVKSIAKIMPDVAIKFGRAAATQVKRGLLVAKLWMVMLGVVVLFVLSNLGIWVGSGQIMSNVWFLPLVAGQAIIGTMLVIEQSVSSAAFRNRLITGLTLATNISISLISIIVVLISRDPFLLVATVIIPSILNIVLLRRFGGYDLDSERHSAHRVSIKWVLKEYGGYMFVTYILFLFNRFVYGLPLAFMILIRFGMPAAVIGNAAIAISLVQHSWDVADTPLASLRAPLLARLHAIENPTRLREVQRVMIAITVISSSIIAIAMLAIGPWFFNFLFGQKYEDGISWGIAAMVCGLLGNIFSLGNSTLHQTNRFVPELVGTAIGGLVIIASVVFIAPLSAKNLPLIVILGYVFGRVSFWVYTDLWADSTIFKWEGAAVKYIGLLAAAGGLAATIIINRSSMTIPPVALVGGLLVFGIIFKILGGIGEQNRLVMREVLSSKYRWITTIL